VDTSQVVTTNAKGAQAYGIEAELTANLTANDRLQISATAQDTKMDELMAADGRIGPNDLAHAVQLKGKELPHAPHFSGTVAYEHTFELDSGGRIIPRIATHFESKSWLSYFNQGAPDQQKSYTRTDVTLRYEPAEAPGRSRPSSRTSRTRTSRPGPAPPACRTTIRSGRRSTSRRAPGASV
jgi:iron complex outermembrane receptor protein